MGHFSSNFSKSPRSETTGPIEKIKGGAKVVRTSSIFMQILWRFAAARLREKEKLGVFFSFVVCHALDLELE